MMNRVDFEITDEAQGCDICAMSGISTPAKYRTKRRVAEFAGTLFENPKRLHVCKSCYEEMEVKA
jgi:hypothetical protein